MDSTQHRPPTPDSPLTNRDSLYDATTTIDDLTQALENVSRVPSPEPPALFFCCCGRDDCENVQAWLNMKARLESRLTLSAEVGQALLQRHEAYVRRHQSQQKQQRNGNMDMPSEEDQTSDDGAATQDQLDELTKENKALEKRLTQALVNNEVTEVSNKTILQELAEAKVTISRLTTSHARSVGWDTRLSAAMKEKDDMQQERDSESQRSRLAESRFAALKERTSKLQSEVRRLQNALEEQREHRLESSSSILSDARARLETIQRTVGAPLQETQPELTGVLETLVDDNETLKRDNAELQALLADAREDCRALQEEVEDQRVNPPPPRSGAGTPSHLRQHFHTGSVPTMLSPSYRRNSSTERRSSRRYEPLTPETNRRPLSPTDSLTNSESKWTFFSQPQPRYPVSPSHASFEVDEQDGDSGSALEKRTHKPLFLLARSRGVQTDPWPTPAPIPYPPSHSPSSAASVYSDTLAPSSNNTGPNTSPAAASFSALIERTTALLQRMQSADALSLTNRLKRQQIRGADVAHLSRSTIAGILSDVGKQLRAGPQQDDELRAGRRDVRALLGVLREMFGAMGEMRVVLNEVILDPGSAGRVREAAMDPGKHLAAGEEQGAGGGAGGHGPVGWMAPLSKLFAGSPAPRGEGERAAMASPLAAPRPMPARFVPKLGPALAASATTVNVEFSGAGVGRAMTSTFDAPVVPVGSTAPAPAPAQGVMGIFAGAPRTKTPDPWVIIPNPKLPRRMPTSLLRPGGPGPGGRHAHRMSRNVDAVLDGVGTPARRVGDGEDGEEEPDYLGPLFERTLRRRGLSDSSIHSTFTSQAAEDGEAPPQSAGVSRREAAWLESGSVLQALSRRVQSFRSGMSGGSGSEQREQQDGASLSGSEGGLGTSPPAPAAPIAVGGPRPSRRSSRAHDSPLKTSASVSGFGFLPALATLVPSGEAADMARSLREESALLSRTYRNAGHGHGHHGVGAERDFM